MLEPFYASIGVLPDADVARLAGCTETNVIMYRRRHGIARPTARVERPPSPPVSRGSLLDAWRHVVGTLPDAEVAALAGCTAANVSLYRRRRGIPSSIARNVIVRQVAPRPPEAATAPLGAASEPPTAGASAAYRVTGSADTRVIVAPTLEAARARVGPDAVLTWIGDLL